MKIGLGIGIPNKHAVSGGGSPAFSPSDIANLELWLEADSGVTDSGGAVSAWADQSGQGNNAAQVTPAEQPTLISAELNGLDVLRFSSDSMQGTGLGLSGDQPVTCFLVAKNTLDYSGAADGALFELGNDSGAANDRRMMIFSYESGTGDVIRVSPGNGTYTNSPNNTWHIITISYAGSGANWTMRRNGSPLTLSSPLFGVMNFTTGDYTIAWSRRFTTGEYERFVGDIYGVMVYNRALNGTEIGQVESYLSEKTGITLA